MKWTIPILACSCLIVGGGGIAFSMMSTIVSPRPPATSGDAAITENEQDGYSIRFPATDVTRGEIEYSCGWAPARPATLYVWVVEGALTAGDLSVRVSDPSGRVLAEAKRDVRDWVRMRQGELTALWTDELCDINLSACDGFGITIACESSNEPGQAVAISAELSGGGPKHR